MYRLIALLLLPLLLVTPVWAQQQLNVYPGNIVNRTTTAVTVATNNTAGTLFSWTIPRTFLTQFARPFVGAGALHVMMFGTLTTQALEVGTANMGCNFGGTTATISLVNGATLTAGLSAVPWMGDLWVRQLSTGEIVHGNLQIQTAVNTRLTFMARVTGTTAITSPQTLACAWQWASASHSNSFIMHNATLVVGE